MTSLPTSGVAVITACSAHRLDHLLNQQAFLRQRHPEVIQIVVWLDAELPPELSPAVVLHSPPGSLGFQLAAARNLGAATAISAGATLLIFLDADCLPGQDLIRRYQAAAGAHPRAVLCGPVTYLPAGFSLDTATDLSTATSPHQLRPAPAPGQTQVADYQEYALFWSLSFAVTAGTWIGIGGFDERYQGYGAEDTDFAFKFRKLQVGMYWVGGADAYHQYHPTSSPPWHNLADIVRNAGLFFDRWGEWPMLGWLKAFQEAGAVEFRDGRYQVSDV